MAEPVFADKQMSLKDYLIDDVSKTNYNQMYGVLQDGLTRMQRLYSNASSKQEAEELESLVNSFKNGLYLLEKAYAFIASQRD